MNPILKTACETFEAKMASALEEFSKEGSWFNGGNPEKDSFNARDPAQRASFMAADPNRANYGPKLKAQNNLKSKTEDPNFDPSVKENF